MDVKLPLLGELPAVNLNREVGSVPTDSPAPLGLRQEASPRDGEAREATPVMAKVLHLRDQDQLKI